MDDQLRLAADMPPAPPRDHSLTSFNMKSISANRVFAVFAVLFAAVVILAVAGSGRAIGQTNLSKSTKRVIIEPYKGPPIYLEEKRAVVSPSIVRHDPFTDKYEDGKTRVERQVALYSDEHRESDGYYREFYPNGKPFIDGNYRQGKQHGEWSYFYDNGQLQRKVTYQDGRLHGAWDRFRADGTLAAKHSYENGLRHGTWQTFDATGKQLLQEENYSQGKPNGTMKAWHPNGKLRVQVEIKDGKQHGRTQQWDENGKLVADVGYIEGKLDGTATTVRLDGTTVVQEYKNGLLISEKK
jgi:antitoxin component YwqK of YwqJK toxin-antitoxin module